MRTEKDSSFREFLMFSRSRSNFTNPKCLAVLGHLSMLVKDISIKRLVINEKTFSPPHGQRSITVTATMTHVERLLVAVNNLINLIMSKECFKHSKVKELRFPKGFVKHKEP